MELKLEELVEKLAEDLKKHHAGEIKYLYDFVHEGEQYRAIISVKRHEELNNE